MIGLFDEEVDNKFGFLLEVFEYGIFFYGGIVYGLDWLVMLLVVEEFIWDVIVFLKI